MHTTNEQEIKEPCYYVNMPHNVIATQVEDQQTLLH